MKENFNLLSTYVYKVTKPTKPSKVFFVTNLTKKNKTKTTSQLFIFPPHREVFRIHQNHPVTIDVSILWGIPGSPNTTIERQKRPPANSISMINAEDVLFCVCFWWVSINNIKTRALLCKQQKPGKNSENEKNNTTWITLVTQKSSC